MNYLSKTQLNDCLNKSDSVYKNLSYKLIKENILIPSQSQSLKYLYTYTFKFAPEKLDIADQIILSSIQDSSLLIAYSFDTVLSDIGEESFYLFTGHSYFSLYNPNSDNILTNISRLRLREYISNITLDTNNVLLINNIKSDLSVYKILCVNIFIVSATNLLSLVT